MEINQQLNKNKSEIIFNDFLPFINKEKTKNIQHLLNKSFIIFYSTANQIDMLLQSRLQVYKKDYKNVSEMFLFSLQINVRGSHKM